MKQNPAARTRALRQFGEALFPAMLAEFMRAEQGRHAAGKADQAPSPGDARAEAVLFHEGAGTHPGPLWRAWLYSGNKEGEDFGPRREGHMRVSDDGRSGAAYCGPTERQEAERLLHERLVRQLGHLEQALWLLWMLAPRHATRGQAWTAWVAVELNRRGERNQDGGEWSAVAVRNRVTRISQRLVEEFAQAVAA